MAPEIFANDKHGWAHLSRLFMLLGRKQDKARYRPVNFDDDDYYQKPDFISSPVADEPTK